jgi:hypothetical protein
LNRSDIDSSDPVSKDSTASKCSSVDWDNCDGAVKDMFYHYAPVYNNRLYNSKLLMAFEGEESQMDGNRPLFMYFGSAGLSKAA